MMCGIPEDYTVSSKFKKCTHDLKPCEQDHMIQTSILFSFYLKKLISGYLLYANNVWYLQ